MNNHNGQRKQRGEKTRKPRLGYYLIITDTKETEKNYFDGLRDSLPTDVKGNFVIKTITTDTKKLVSEINNVRARHPNFAKTWVIFDRDQNYQFDQIIKDAEALSASAGWSNPCFEVWLNSYFGEMPNYPNSTSCCNGFAKTFKAKTKKKYKKNDQHIYKTLKEHGNEEQAISIAELKLREAQGKSKNPSEMCPATTVHELIKEIREKISE